MATIYDVAREADVSTATVSRVLNGSYSVTDEKKRRVMEAIEKVGYQIPNKSKLNQTAGLPPRSDIRNGSGGIILAICSEFIFSLLHQIQTTATELGYSLVVTHYESSDEFEHLRSVFTKIQDSISGVILINTCDSTPAFQMLLREYPIVQIGVPVMTCAPNIVVYNDEVKMSQDATDYLLKEGRRRIGILTTEPTERCRLFYKRRRLNGYYLALMNAGIPVDKNLIEYVDVTIEGGYEGANNLLKRNPDLDAILCITDVIAHGAVFALRNANKCPRDILIFSLDSSEIWDYVHKSFPYIDPHHEEMGATAMQLMNGIINGSLTKDCNLVIPHTLCVGAK